jgi:copper chaperone NosL
MKTKLHTLTRALMALISLALAAVYVLPLWHIRLEAPQYPEGLGMKIWLNHLSGDLNTINGLNHYIGMHEIHPESFTELAYMPIIVGFFIGLGLLTALLNRRILLTLWFGLLGLSGVAGLLDFWRWTWDYGHNLNPHAAIKVPGMTYQPPVFGSKNLLNFKAHSFPDLGGWLMIGIGFLVFALVAWEWLRKHPEHKLGNIAKKVTQMALALSLVTALWGCAPKTEALLFTQDTCHFCKMTLMDPKYGAELLTKKGKVLKYDSIECLVRELKQDRQLSEKVHSLWVLDSQSAGSLLPAEQALYLHSLKLPSPMGAFLTPLKDQASAQSLEKQFPGEILTWEAIQKQVNERSEQKIQNPDMISDLEKQQNALNKHQSETSHEHQ